MFKYIKAILLDKVIRNRILFVLFILLLTRILSVIPLPMFSVSNMSSYIEGNQLLSMLNLFTGGGLSNLSIVMLGVQPYITASIIMQLATVLFPSLKKMQQEDGEAGRRRFMQYSRLLSIPFAALQSYGLLVLFSNNNILPEMNNKEMLLTVLTITAGSMLMMWLGERINEKGVGNGVSLIIMSGIVAQFPSQISDLYQKGITSENLPAYIAMFVIFIVTLLAIVAISEGERRVDMTYAKQSRGYAAQGLNHSYLPIRLTTAGVIPIIFAASLLSLPSMFAPMLQSSNTTMLQSIGNTLISVFGNSWIHNSLYFILIFAFTFFYTFVTFDVERTGDNLQKSGAFLPGVRPGEATNEYLSTILIRVTLLGALFLGIVAVLPNILGSLTGITAITIGGTSLLITVSVVIDLVKKIDAQLTMREY